MRQAQINKLANQIVALELVVSNPDSSQEDKSQAERQIIQLSSMLACLPNGLEIMTRIDAVVQSKLANTNTQKEGTNNGSNEGKQS